MLAKLSMTSAELRTADTDAVQEVYAALLQGVHGMEAKFEAVAPGRREFRPLYTLHQQKSHWWRNRP